jgi:hypothetical protein
VIALIVRSYPNEGVSRKLFPRRDSQRRQPEVQVGLWENSEGFARITDLAKLPFRALLSAGSWATEDHMPDVEVYLGRR